MVQNPQRSYEDKFDLQENEPVRETHFHVNGFATTRKCFNNFLL